MAMYNDARDLLKQVDPTLQNELTEWSFKAEAIEVTTHKAVLANGEEDVFADIDTDHPFDLDVVFKAFQQKHAQEFQALSSLPKTMCGCLHPPCRSAGAEEVA